jgi:hypothetical protein
MKQLTLTILITVTLSIAGLWLVYQLVPIAALSAANDTVGNYLQTVGTIYAVLLAFVVFVVWGQHNEAAAFVSREANELADLHRVVKELPQSVQAEAVLKLRAYIDAVLGTEWSGMEQGRECPRAAGQLDELWRALQSCEPLTERDKILYGEALTRFNDLSDARTDRLRSARTHLPSILWILLLSGAGVVVGSMYLFALRQFRVHALMTGALSGAVSHVLYLIFDLDSPFSGDWRVTREPFEMVRRQME